MCGRLGFQHFSCCEFSNLGQSYGELTLSPFPALATPRQAQHVPKLKEIWLLLFSLDERVYVYFPMLFGLLIIDSGVSCGFSFCPLWTLISHSFELRHVQKTVYILKCSRSKKCIIFLQFHLTMTLLLFGTSLCHYQAKELLCSHLSDLRHRQWKSALI